MQGFITHCGAAEVSREEAFAVPVPEHTRSHRPASYEQLTTFVELQLQQLGLQTISQAYALNRKGQHFFAKYVLDVGDNNDTRGLAVVFRQSYNKQFKAAVAMGMSTFICDNLAISGDWFQVMSKNTKNGWERFQDQCILASFKSDPLAAYWETARNLDDWSTIELTEREGYRCLGELYGRNLLKSEQLNIAIEDWRKPRHEEFEARNLLNLYQDCTEGLKKGPVASLPERHIELHQAFLTLQATG